MPADEPFERREATFRGRLQAARSVVLPRRVVAALTAVLAVIAVTVTARHAVVEAAEPHADGMPVLAHYMPWFEAPYSLGAGRYGWHWTMDTRNPTVVRSDGRREIASHFDPLIGPYDSDDPAVLRYHLLLMKTAGIDGVLIDWYGVSGSNADVAVLQRNTRAVIAEAQRVGLRFAVVYEDRFARGADDVRAALDYARSQWFDLPGYLRLPGSRGPYLGVFGPIGITDPTVWRAAVASIGPVDLRTLWNDDDAGAAADGQFTWPFDSATGPGWADRLETYYTVSAAVGRRVTAVGYPGFDDYYAQGQRNGTSLFTIPDGDGATLRRTLQLASAAGGRVDSVQLATWNDFGEGTMIEPTVQRGFRSLVQVQQFTDAPGTEADLRTVLRWYRLAQREGPDSATAVRAFDLLCAGEIAAARRLLG